MVTTDIEGVQREYNNYSHMQWLLTPTISGDKQHHWLVTPFTHVMKVPKLFFSDSVISLIR